MIRILMPVNSFLAFIEYYPSQKQLFLVMSKGRRFRYDNFPNDEFAKIEQAQNRGNYISTQIVNKGKFTGMYVDTVPMNIVNEIRSPAFARHQH